MDKEGRPAILLALSIVSRGAFVLIAIGIIVRSARYLTDAGIAVLVACAVVFYSRLAVLHHRRRRQH